MAAGFEVTAKSKSRKVGHSGPAPTFDRIRPLAGRIRIIESADKPGSVGDSHSSGISITTDLKQPTRIQCEPHLWIPIWPCSERGLPCHELLPVARCALTAPFHPYRPAEAGVGGLLSAALSVGSRLPGVTWRSALRSPDFPPPGASFTAETVMDAGLAATAWPTRRQD